MKEILLTQGYATIVDDEDYEMLSQYKWHVTNGNNKYAATAKFVNGKIVRISMHRLVMGIIKSPRSVEVDHIDGNGLNNKRSNLRICERKHNARNTRTHNKSGYRGINIIRDKWGVWYAANISVDKKRIYLGCFDNPLTAAIAYNNAAIKYHGEFARLNEI